MLNFTWLITMEKMSKIIEILYKDPTKTMLALRLSILAAALLVGIMRGDPIESDGW